MRTPIILAEANLDKILSNSLSSIQLLNSQNKKKKNYTSSSIPTSSLNSTPSLLGTKVISSNNISNDFSDNTHYNVNNTEQSKLEIFKKFNFHLPPMPKPSLQIRSFSTLMSKPSLQLHSSSIPIDSIEKQSNSNSFMSSSLFMPKPSLQLNSFSIPIPNPSSQKSNIDNDKSKINFAEQLEISYNGKTQDPKKDISAMTLHKQFLHLLHDDPWGTWTLEVPKILTKDDTIAILNKKRFSKASSPAQKANPTQHPTSFPTSFPSSSPTSSPTSSPISPTSSPTSSPTTSSPTSSPTFPTSSPTLTALPTSFPTASPIVLTATECYLTISLVVHNKSLLTNRKLMTGFCSSYCADVIPNQEFFNIMCSKHKNEYCYPKYLSYLEAIKNPTSEDLDLACEDVKCLRDMTEIIVLTRITEKSDKLANLDLQIEVLLKALHGVDISCLKVDDVHCYSFIFQMYSSDGPVCACWTALHKATERLFPHRREVIVQKNAKDFFCSSDSQGIPCGEKIDNFFTDNPCPELDGSNPVCSSECKNKFSVLEDNCCLNSLAKFSDQHIGLHYGTEVGYIQNWIQNTCDVAIPAQKCALSNDTNSTVELYPDASDACNEKIFHLVANVMESPTQKATNLLCNSECFFTTNKHKILHDWLCTKIEGEYCYPNFILLNGETSNELDHACRNIGCLKEMMEVLFMMHNDENKNFTDNEFYHNLGKAINGIDLRCLKVNNQYCSLDLEKMSSQDSCECVQKFEETTLAAFPNDNEIEMQQGAADFFCAIDTVDEVPCAKKMENFFASDPCPVLNGSNPSCTPTCQKALQQVSGSCCLNEMVEFGERHANAHFGTTIGYVQQWIETSCQVKIPPPCNATVTLSENLLGCHEIQSMDKETSENHIMSQSCMKVNVSSGGSFIFDFQAESSATIDDIVILIWPFEDCSVLPDTSALLYTRGPRHKQIFTVPEGTTVISVVVFPYQSPFLWKASLCHENSSHVDLPHIANRHNECSSYCNSGIESVTYRYEGETGKDLFIQSAKVISVIPQFEMIKADNKKNGANLLVMKNMSKGFTFTLNPSRGKTFEDCAVDFFIENHKPHLVDVCCMSPTQLRPGNRLGDFHIVETINGDGMKMCELAGNKKKQQESMANTSRMKDYSMLTFSRSSHTTKDFQLTKRSPKSNDILGLSLNQNLIHVYSGLPTNILSWIYGVRN